MIISIILIVLIVLIAIYLFTHADFEQALGFSLVTATCLGAVLIPPAIGSHYNGNEELIKNRPYIMAAIDSDDSEFREQAIQEAIEYNKKVKDGKDALSNPWISWFIDRIWADAEFIPLDYSNMTVKENS